VSEHAEIGAKVCHHVRAIERLTGWQILTLVAAIARDVELAGNRPAGVGVGIEMAFVFSADVPEDVRSDVLSLIGDAAWNASKSL
jgi:hypothetical protein